MAERQEPTGLISSLQHFSVGDGPGIRSTIFFQGCNLHCPWCHNPETISPQPVLLFDPPRCTDCGLCVRACPSGAQMLRAGRHVFARDLCISCGACTAACPADALRLSGRAMTVGEVLAFIEEDRDFYAASGGGVTLSGGEPLLQASFCASLAAACHRQGLPVILDTAGQVPFAAFEQVLPYVDRFYVDLKSGSETGYRDLCGGSLALVLQNMARLVAAGQAVTARIPVIPGTNDRASDWIQMRDVLQHTGVREVHLLPYHRLGAGKYDAIGKPYTLWPVMPPHKEHLRALSAIFAPDFFVTIEG
ncbi:MAG: glycyl-radical enzyme activating protein [Clostridiaceae bacterium]|jgi:pyruvate formate lyase activating enzyme|nr:glycyl-radical enzyme activating protein [Clostridiaceae bacterium]